MAWTAIPDTVIEVGKPVRALDVRNLRDNIPALANGDAGAPRILAAALNAGGAETTWVAGRTAGINTGDVGSYAFLRHATINTALSPGSAYAGSALRYGGVYGDTVSAGTDSTGATPSGTWRCMGNMQATTSKVGMTLFLRIS